MQAIGALPYVHGNLEDISLALSEALANAVVHGNREDPNKKVEVCALCDSPDYSVLSSRMRGRVSSPTQWQTRRSHRILCPATDEGCS
jgi:hypothetical protein